MDSTSFASVLAGVKRMREQYESKESGREAASGDSSTVTDTEKRQKVNEASKEQSQATRPTAQAPTQTPSSQHTRTQTQIGTQTQTNPQTERPQEKITQRPTPQSRPSRGPGTEEPRRASPPPIGVGSSSRVMSSLPRTNSVQMYSQIQVSPSQKGNPLFQSTLMKSKPISYNKEILSDYYINSTLQVLFLSLKYHQLHPEYVWRRCKKLNQGSSVSTRADNVLKILLVVIDVENPQDALRKLNSICIGQDLTLLVAWSFEQAGNYIAMLKDNELSRNKVNLVIKGVKKQDVKSNLIDSLTTVKSINKTDVINLLMEVGSFKDIAQAKEIKISGLGERKIQNLRDAFTGPFVYKDEQ